MDKLQWFKFTPTDWIMGKIQRCPEVTQARFMRLICLYWNKECVLSYEDAEIEIDKEHLEILLSKKIIKVEYDFLVIDFLNEQLENITETSEKRRKAVLERWARVKQKDTSVSNNNTGVLQNDTEKRKSREEKDNIIIENEVLSKNEIFKKQCLESEEWIEIVCMKNKIPKDKIQFALKDFNEHLITSGETKLNISDYKTHFTNWSRKIKSLR